MKALPPSKNPVAHLARIAMVNHEAANAVKGDRYKALADGELLDMLRMSVEELALALRFNHDVVDKAADVANYAAYLASNWEERQ